MRLGFTVTPLSTIANLGVANRLVLLRPLTQGATSFVECMGVVDPRRATGRMGELLAGSPGLRSLVLSSDDAIGSYRALKRDGYAFDAPLEIRREWQLPSGEILTASFLVTLPIETTMPFNFCEYRTLHYYLRENWMTHANGAPPTVGGCRDAS